MEIPNGTSSKLSGEILIGISQVTLEFLKILHQNPRNETFGEIIGGTPAGLSRGNPRSIPKDNLDGIPGGSLSISQTRKGTSSETPLKKKYCRTSGEFLDEIPRKNPGVFPT